MSYAVQGLALVGPPIQDWSLSPYESPTSTLGNAPNRNSMVPAGGAQDTVNGTWINTNGQFTTDSGPAGDLNSGIEFALTCVPGTFVGIGPQAGYVGRVLAPPAGTLVLPMPINYQMCRFEVFGLRWTTTPTGTQAGQDSGVSWTGGGAGQGAIRDTSHVGGQNVGWGILYDPSVAALRYVAKQLSGNTNPDTANVNIGNPANGVSEPFYLDMRVLMPTLTTPAGIQIFLDKTNVNLAAGLTAAQTSWITGTVLPNPAAQANVLGFVPFIGNNTPTGDTANPVLHFYGARWRVGTILACTVENQF